MTRSQESPEERFATVWERLTAETRDDSIEESDRLQAAASSLLPPDAWVLKAQSARWQDTGIDGVRVKVLSPDAAGATSGNADSRRTVMLWMDAGCVYPGHPHPDVEETFVLHGDLRTGDPETGELILLAGDYQRLPGGSRHPEQRTVDGCLCLVICAMDQRV